MKLVASVDGTRHEIPDASLSDLVAFERHFGVPAAVLSPDEGSNEKPRIEWIAFVIYKGLIRLGVFEKSLDFESALDQIEDFDTIEEEGDEADPSSAPSASDSERAA